MNYCNQCKEPLNIGTIQSKDCGGDCLKCMAKDDDTAKQALAFAEGFKAAVDLLKSSDDLYGIGSMCSQWTTEEVAEDLNSKLIQITWKYFHDLNE